jgi:hypothetical protein
MSRRVRSFHASVTSLDDDIVLTNDLRLACPVYGDDCMDRLGAKTGSTCSIDGVPGAAWEGGATSTVGRARRKVDPTPFCDSTSM